MKLTTLLKWGTVILLTLVLVGGLTTTPGVSAQAGAPDTATTMNDLTGPGSLPVVQVTTDQWDDIYPALVQTADGKLLTVFVRGYGDLWSRASTDGGATWGAETQIAGCCRYNPSLARATDGTLWLAYDLRTLIERVDPSGGRVVVEIHDIWYRTSSDGGVTWSAEVQLTPDPAKDYDPVIFQAADGKLWIVWYFYRSGNMDIWYKTSADGGVTWTADTQFTTNSAGDSAPAITQAANGRLVVVWNRGDGELWQRNSSDGGDTWSAETRIAGCCRKTPSLAMIGGVLWLAYENDGDIWYRTSVNQGATWSAEARFTNFVASDSGVTLAALAADNLGLVWHSIRSSNQDIWFGSPGEREDDNPPPYIDWIEHRPQCNPDSDDTIAFRASARDETGVASVSLVWTLDGVAQDPLAMYDDGTHGDEEAGDGVWTVQHEPLPEGSQVTYRARATDTDGNTYLYPRQNSFKVLPPLDKTTGILFVPDVGGYDTSEFWSYYTKALDALGYRYAIWDTKLRCTPDSTVLNQYKSGAVIWAVPNWRSYITHDSDPRTAVQRYLDDGGKLFITGQDIASDLHNSGSGADFLKDYLHATYLQRNTDLYAVTGVTGDPIGDGLALNISGGDGANNQYSQDEVAPIAPAQVAFTYQAGASAMLAEPTWPAEAAPTSPQDAKREPTADAPGAPLQSDAPAQFAESTPSAPAGCSGSCTAGLHVDTGTYKVVYFAFGFEAINSAAYRAGAMERVLAWLGGRPARPAQLMPAYGQAVLAGAVNFTWLNVLGAASYEIQIDVVPTFDSPNLITEIVNGTSYNHSFSTLGMRYWRVRVFPDGGWTAAWPFSITAGVAQVTTDQADDASPALVQTADGKLLTVFGRDGALWSRASTDGGVTWAAEMQIAGCCRYRPSLARAANGTLRLVYDSNYDIWYRTSADHGVTWSAETRLTTDSGDDYDPVVLQAADGKLWVVWQSSPPYYSSSIWYKISANGGATWSADTQLTTYGYAPAIAQVAGGRLVVVWNRYGELWQSSSSDGGATWSAEMHIGDYDGTSRYNPSLAAVGGDLWLTYERGGDIWYRTSVDQGDTWSDETRFTRFVGGDSAPAAAALAPGSIGIAWQSDRSGNPDIWFGSPVERQDINPPPYIEWIEHQPQCNPDSDDTITFRAYARDETGVASVSLVWTLDGVAQADLPMFDDGAHGDGAAGDRVWGIQHPPLPEGSQVAYRARATDTDGNTYLYPRQNSFKVLPPFIKTAAILFVPDVGGANTPYDTAGLRPYYTDALEALGYRYDTWDTKLRCEPGSTILNQYTRGAVIWAVPYSGYATNGSSASIRQLQAYLDAGGKLFITGQNVASNICYSGSGTGFLQDYLHATCRQDDTGRYALAGAAGDPIGNGLALNISGGDGANNQYSKDEVDPIAPAQVVFTYRAGASAMLAEPTRPTEAALTDPQDANRQPASGAPPQPDASAASAASAPADNVGSGTAGLRVDTGIYKVVYFAFGFEAINNAADRTTVMERVLNWLGVSTRSKLYLPIILKAQQGTPPPTPTPLPPCVQFYDPNPSRPGLSCDGSPYLGDAEAPVLMLAFEDLKSEGGAQYVKSIEPVLRDRYITNGQVRLLVKLYPIIAPKAAAAAFCAIGQGKFWEFRDALFTHQTEWNDGDDAAMSGYARSVGMDEARFQTCLADPQTQAQVDAALSFGQDLGVPDVPAFLFVDLNRGQVVGNIVGVTTLADFEAKLQAALNPTPTPTTAPAATTPTPTK